MDEKRGRLSKKERERERDKESMRLGREGKVPQKQMCRNCMPPINVNTPCREGSIFFFIYVHISLTIFMTVIGSRHTNPRHINTLVQSTANKQIRF